MNRFRHVLALLLMYLVIPGSLMVQLFISLPVPPKFSWRWLGIFCVLFILVEGLVWLQATAYLRPVWRNLGNRKKQYWILTAGIFAGLLFAYAAPDKTQVMERLPFLAPVETLELRPILSAASPSIDIWKVKIGEARLSNAEMRLEGNWQAQEDNLITSDPHARLTVSGKVPRAINIVFMRSPTAGQVAVRWDGKEEMIDLQGAYGQEAHHNFRYDTTSRQAPGLAILIRLAALPAWICLAFWATGIFYHSLASEINPESSPVRV